jgi:hypothetical protein
MHQLLKLQHHRHTGKLLHHQHTSYRSLTLLLVIAGCFMVTVNTASHAAAANLGVSAMVNPPLPTTPPVIATPVSGTTLSGSSTLIVGSCPAITPQVIVRIRVDGNPVGTGACDSNNDFTVPVYLDAGSHQITAETLTISGQQGPGSSPIQVQTNAASTMSAATISAVEPFIYLGADRTATWAGQIATTAGGALHIHLDWGDGSQSNLTVDSGQQSFSHQYTTLASRNIWLAVANSSGTAVSEQFAVAAYTSLPAVSATLASRAQATPFDTPTVAGLYGLYLTAVSVTAVVWLEAVHAARTHARLRTAA